MDDDNMEELITNLARALEQELGHFMQPNNEHSWRDVARGLVQKMDVHSYPKHLAEVGGRRGYVFFFSD